MRKIGWYAFSALVVSLILGGGVVLLAVNLYVQSPQVQQRIRLALTASLRMPVSIKKTTITPWEGLRIDGISAQGGLDEAKKPGKSANSVTAASFRVRFALSPLLSHRQLVIREVLVDRPKMIWAQDDAGRWQFPAEREVPRRKKLAGKSPAAPVNAPLSDPAPPSSVGAASPPASEQPVNNFAPSASHADQPAVPAPPARKLENFVLTFGKFRLRHGNLEFQNQKRGLIGRFEEVNLDGHVSDPIHAEGTVAFERASLPRIGIRLSQFHSNFVYDHQEGLSFIGGRAGLAGGLIQADYRLHTGEPDSPFSIQCHMNNVSIGQLIKEAGSRVSLAEGRLQGDLSVSGRSDVPDSRTATGKFELVDAQVRGFPLFQMLGDALHIADLSRMQFKKAQLDYTVEGVWMHVDPLLLVSNDLQILAQGRYQTDEDRLDLHARLTVDAAVSKQLPRFVNEKFTSSGDGPPGSQSIDFDITGPLSKPTTNLYKQVLPNDMGGLLQTLLGSKPKKSKTVRPVDPSPTPAAADVH